MEGGSEGVRECGREGVREGGKDWGREEVREALQDSTSQAPFRTENYVGVCVCLSPPIYMLGWYVQELLDMLVKKIYVKIGKS